jgi:hypothetical protein
MRWFACTILIGGIAGCYRAIIQSLDVHAIRAETCPLASDSIGSPTLLNNTKNSSDCVPLLTVCAINIRDAIELHVDQSPGCRFAQTLAVTHGAFTDIFLTPHHRRAAKPQEDGHSYGAKRINHGVLGSIA